MNKSKLAVISYCAGYFDGEGCIATRWDKDNAFRYWTPTLTVVSRKNKDSVDVLHGTFGGAVTMNWCKRDQKYMYYWQLHGSEGIRKALKLMLPYLRIKREVAQVAIRLVERIIVSKKDGRRLSDHEKQQRRLLVEKIRELNHQIPQELVRAETERRNTENSVKLQSDPQRTKI